MENQALPDQAIGADSMRRERAWVVPGLILLYLALRLPWVFTVPSMQAPDEPQHLWIVHYISQHFHSPTPQEVLDGGLNALYGTVPPFGYYIGALVAWLLQGVVPFIVAARLGSVIVGIPSLWAAHAAGKEIFNTRFLSLCLPLLVVVHPQLVFTQSYCNSDGTLISLSAIAMLIMVRCLKYGADVRKALLLGCTIGGAALAKTNGFALVPALLWGLWKSCRNRHESSARFVRLSAVFAVGLVLVCAWPLLRNYIEYHGDMLGTHTMNQIWIQILPHHDGKPVFPWPALNKIGWWRYVWFDYWGLFGMMDMYLWRPLYLVYLGIVLFSIMGWSGLRIPFRRAHAEESASIVNAQTPGIWNFFALSFLLNLAAIVYVTVIGVSGPHGRYLFPCEIPILCMILSGTSRLGPRTERILCSLLVALCLVSVVGGWAYYYAGKSWSM